MDSTEGRRIRSLRPPKPLVDPWVAHGSTIDSELRPGGNVERALTIFLAGAECPFTCSFCDLWRWTLNGPTPPGALPTQVRRVLETLERPLPHRLKLYNASNFFDRRAVPPEDWPALAELASAFASVTVESHANMVGTPVLEFSSLVPRLEVAIGLETIHPGAVAHLNKGMDVSRNFDGAAGFLELHNIELRVFVLVGAPYVPREESIEWTVRTAEHAAKHSAAAISLIPVRGGNGELERLEALGHFAPPHLRQLEAALDRCIGLGNAVVTADLWDVDRLPACTECGPRRVERMRRMNVTGRDEPPVGCPDCD